MCYATARGGIRGTQGQRPRASGVRVPRVISERSDDGVRHVEEVNNSLIVKIDFSVPNSEGHHSDTRQSSTTLRSPRGRGQGRGQGSPLLQQESPFNWNGDDKNFPSSNDVENDNTGGGFGGFGRGGRGRGFRGSRGSPAEGPRRGRGGWRTRGRRGGRGDASAMSVPFGMTVITTSSPGDNSTRIPPLSSCSLESTEPEDWDAEVMNFDNPLPAVNGSGISQQSINAGHGRSYDGCGDGVDYQCRSVAAEGHRDLTDKFQGCLETATPHESVNLSSTRQSSSCDVERAQAKLNGDFQTGCSVATGSTAMDSSRQAEPNRSSGVPFEIQGGGENEH